MGIDPNHSEFVCHDGQMSSSGPSIVRVVGVYNAAGTLRGEISYVLRRTFAGEHCALCDITHGPLRRRPTWDRGVEDFAARSGIDVVLCHLDDAPPAVLEHPEFQAPAVFLERSDGSVEPLLSAEALETCQCSPQQLFDLLDRAVEEHR